MLDKDYKELLNNWEVQPPLEAWAFIDKTIHKPWFTQVWGKVSIISFVAVISVAIFYVLNTSKKVKPLDEFTKLTYEKPVQVCEPPSWKPGAALNTGTNGDYVLINKPAEVTNNESPGSASKSAEIVNSIPGKNNPEVSQSPNQSSVMTTEPLNQAPPVNSTSIPESNNNTPLTLKVTPKAICVGNLTNIKISLMVNNCILDFGDNHQVNLTPGKNTVIPYIYALPGVYTITVRSADAILASESIKVEEKTQAYFTAKTNENKYIQFSNISISADKFVWFFDDGKQETVKGNSEIKHYYYSNSRRIFHVKLIAMNSETGCSDTFESEVNNPNFKNFFNAPIKNNVFTPNGDGMNDVFEIPLSEFKEWHMIIVDETGKTVFETDQQDKFWNGKLNNSGNECQAGTYHYYIKYMQPDDTEMHLRTGYITLIRE